VHDETLDVPGRVHESRLGSSSTLKLGAPVSWIGTFVTVDVQSLNGGSALVRQRRRREPGPSRIARVEGGKLQCGRRSNQGIEVRLRREGECRAVPGHVVEARHVVGDGHVGVGQVDGLVELEAGQERVEGNEGHRQRLLAGGACRDRRDSTGQRASARAEKQIADGRRDSRNVDLVVLSIDGDAFGSVSTGPS